MPSELEGDEEDPEASEPAIGREFVLLRRCHPGRWSRSCDCGEDAVTLLSVNEATAEPGPEFRSLLSNFFFFAFDCPPPEDSGQFMRAFLDSLTALS
jgi:hypothetical protein